MLEALHSQLLSFQFPVQPAHASRGDVTIATKGTGALSSTKSEGTYIQVLEQGPSRSDDTFHEQRIERTRRRYLAAILEVIHFGPSHVLADAPVLPLMTDPPVGLTTRVLAMLRLVTNGLTNQEIADRLAIGLRTVTSHVTHAPIRLTIT